MINGITFSEQLITSANFAHFMHTFLNKANGITKGCGISYANDKIYVQKGYFIEFGRMVQVVGTEEISTPDVPSGRLYCKMVFEIDLTQENTAETFSQGYFKTLTGTNGYPELTQQDLDNDGTLYQMPWCQYTKSTSGISDFRDLREILSLESIWSAISNQNTQYKNEFDTYFAAQSAIIEQMIEDLENEGYAKADVVNELINTELPELKKSVSDGKTLVAAAITAKKVAAAASDTFAVLAEKISQIVLGSGNAAKADVLAGKTFTNDDGVEYTGTMSDNSGTTKSATPSLDAANSRLQMTVPATGKYDTASKLTAAYFTIRSLIGLTADKLWYNTTILGLKSSRTGQAAKTWTPGTTDQTIAAGTCIIDTQTIKGDKNLIEANIKKGVTIFGKTGTWEGYVAAATDLYYNGANAAGFTAAGDTYATAKFESTYINLSCTTSAANSVKLTAGKNYNLAGYSYLDVEMYLPKNLAAVTSASVSLYKGEMKVKELTFGDYSSNAGSTITMSFPLASVQTSFAPMLSFILRTNTIQVKRIRIR